MLERPVRAADEGGGAAETWEPVATLWAAVTARSGKEEMFADRVSGERRVEVTIRHRDDVTPGMRFRLGERQLDIRAVLDEDGHRRWLKCDCEERDL
jgi:SPP1 family predicted phage head-tail adaptor